MIIPSLLLQEASKNLKSKTIVERQMERQIKLWDWRKITWFAERS